MKCKDQTDDTSVWSIFLSVHLFRAADVTYTKQHFMSLTVTLLPDIDSTVCTFLDTNILFFFFLYYTAVQHRVKIQPWLISGFCLFILDNHNTYWCSQTVYFDLWLFILFVIFIFWSWICCFPSGARRTLTNNCCFFFGCLSSRKIPLPTQETQN